MSHHPALARHISAGEVLRPWIMLGPLYEDCSAHVEGLTLFERRGSQVGRTVTAAAVDEALALLSGGPCEGNTALLRGQTFRWEFARKPEPYLAWGQYNISNHLGMVLLSTIVTPQEDGMRRWRLSQRINARVVLTLDGNIIFDTDGQTPTYANGTLSYEFGAFVPPGEHRLSAAMVRLARSAQVGLMLMPLDGNLDARVPLAAEVDPAARAAIEHEVSGVALGRDLFHPDQTIALRLSRARGTTPLRVTLRGPDTPRVLGNEPLLLSPAEGQAYGNTPQMVPPETEGNVPLCRGSELPDGSYRIFCEWLGPGDDPITSTSFDIRKVSEVQHIPGPDRYQERRTRALEFLSSTTEWHPSPPVWKQVARYALGQYAAVDEQELRALCTFIDARKDCADFAIQGMLRMMAWEQRERRLSPQINALMKATVLGFKYWVDEPGDTVMYMGSENHRLLFHVAEWMAGQLFPTEEFTNSRERGLFHALKGRTFITEWIRQRGRYGFDEWHSNAYYPICIAPLLNVYDFAISEDVKLKEMAGALLDVMIFNMAADSFRGTFGTTHGRSYALYCKHAEMDDTASTYWLLFGNGALVDGTFGMAPVSLATSAYHAPAALYQIANDAEAVVESRQRQGILTTSKRHADFIVYRTPDYTLSAVQDHRKGEYETSTHIAQITLPNRAAIFWSCPQTSSEGSGLRPDYWSGSTILPRVIQYQNVVALHWHLNEFAWMTHCLFEQERFDKVQIQDGWVCAQVENAYVAIWAYGGLRVGEGGQYGGRELLCDSRVTTWLAECGRAADWGSFERFVEAVCAAVVGCDGDTLVYQSPSIGRFESGWATRPTVEGEPIQLRGYPLVDSPWATSRFGSGEFVIRYGGEDYELWLNQ
jgi:hypothetical protein